MATIISYTDLEQLVKKLFGEDWYPKKLPNGMWEIAKGVFTNEKGLEEFSKALNSVTPEQLLYYLLQTGQITLEEYLKAQELPSETINLLRNKYNEHLRTKDK